MNFKSLLLLTSLFISACTSNQEVVPQKEESPPSRPHKVDIPPSRLLQEEKDMLVTCAWYYSVMSSILKKQGNEHGAINSNLRAMMFSKTLSDHYGKEWTSKSFSDENLKQKSIAAKEPNKIKFISDSYHSSCQEFSENQKEIDRKTKELRKSR